MEEVVKLEEAKAIKLEKLKSLSRKKQVHINKKNGNHFVLLDHNNSLINNGISVTLYSHVLLKLF